MSVVRGMRPFAGGVLGAVAALSLAACSASPSDGGPPPSPVPVSSTAAPAGSASASASGPATVETTGATAAQPCVGATAPTRYDHVVWVVMENKPAGAALRAADAPTTARLAAACAQATDYHAVAHPSLPNYLALTSGSTHGVDDDASPAVHRIAGSSIFAEVVAAGGTWATYAESMPGPCSRTSAGSYAVKHNPAAYYVQLGSTCAAHDLPMGSLRQGSFASALTTGTLPSFSLVVPNLCDDTHDCSVATGDAWLSRFLAAVTASPTYATGRTAVLVTWDEDDGSHANRVGLLAIAPSVRPGTTDAHLATHRSLLRTTEHLLGLPTTLLPGTASMAADLGLLAGSAG